MPGREKPMLKAIQDLPDNKGLKLYMEKRSRLEELFLRNITQGEDFNVRMEVRGVKGRVLHVKITTDEIGKPD